MANVLFRQKLTLAAASQPASDLPVGQRLRRPVQPVSKNISLSTPLDAPPKSEIFSRASRPDKRAYRDRHGRWVRDAVDAAASGARCGRGAAPNGCERFNGVQTTGADCGRQSRVVLTPVAGAKFTEAKSAQPGLMSLNPWATVTTRIRSPGRARNKPLKPLCGECRLNPSEPVATTLVCFIFCTRGCGCSGHPAFPVPSVIEGQRSCTARVHRAARIRTCVHSAL